MSDGALQDLFHRYVDCLNGRRRREIGEVVADVLMHNGEKMSRDEWWDSQIEPNVEAIPDLRWSVEEVVAFGDRLFVRYRDSGTPTSRWLEFEPTGAAISFREFVFYTVCDGKLAEMWGIFDAAAAMDQLKASGSGAGSDPKGV